MTNKPTSGRRQRRVHSPEFKARVALAALREDKTLAELSQQYALHPTQIAEWRRQLLEHAADVFGRKSKRTREAKVRKLGGGDAAAPQVQFESALALDAPALSPLPATRYALGCWKQAKVNIDYHVEFDGHYYSVPHRLVGGTVQMRAGAGLLEIFHANQRVACHALSPRRGQHTTTPEHMPASHRAHREWTPAKLIAWGSSIGVATAGVVTWQLEIRPHPEQGYRASPTTSTAARSTSPALRLYRLSLLRILPALPLWCIRFGEEVVL